jgi:etoposide-induced 2.4 mRNA
MNKNRIAYDEVESLKYFGNVMRFPTRSIVHPTRIGRFVHLSTLSNSFLFMEVLRAIAQGIRDSVQYPICFFVLYGSTTLSQRTMQCTITNSIIFLSSYILYQFVVKPTGNLLFSPLGSLLHYIQPYYSVFYFGFWIYPTYLVSFVANSKHFGEIARRSNEIFGKKQPSRAKSVSGLASDFVKLLYRSLFMFVFMVCCFCVSLIPSIGRVLGVVLLTFVGSFFSFEHIWILRGWSLDQQLDYFETKWPYFFGFGTLV